MTGNRHTLTRSEAAARLGVSTSTIRRMEFDVLHPEQDDRGVWRFDPDELAALPAKYVRKGPHTSATSRPTDEARAIAKRGRLAARIFKMFARNLTLPQITVRTNQPPDVVRTLYHEWMTSLDEGEWSRRSGSD